LLHGYGTLEKPVTELWGFFLKENAARLRKIGESDESTVYRYAPLDSVQQCVELEEWDEKANEFEREIWGSANRLNCEFPREHLLSRIAPYTDDPPSDPSEVQFIPPLPGPPNPDYLSLAGCEAEDFERAKRQFEAKWHLFPHHVCFPQQEPIVLFREELWKTDPNIQLFIPVSEVTTKEELEKRWSEVVTWQKILYTTKRRPHRTRFESLLQIYDLRRDLSPSKVASKMGMSRSAIEKQYKRVFRDIHGTPPEKGPKNQEAKFRRRRKTRMGFEGIEATYGYRESKAEVLRSVFLDQGLPLNKLDAIETLSSREREKLKEGLKDRMQKQPRNRF
jgi:hypothetical protein